MSSPKKNATPAEMARLAELNQRLYGANSRNNPVRPTGTEARAPVRPTPPTMPAGTLSPRSAVAGKVDGPKKNFPDNMSLVPNLKGTGVSVGPGGMPQIGGPSDMMYRGPAPQAKPGQVAYKKGGSTSKTSSRADGIAQRGKTKGRYI